MLWDVPHMYGAFNIVKMKWDGIEWDGIRWGTLQRKLMPMENLYMFLFGHGFQWEFQWERRGFDLNWNSPIVSSARILYRTKTTGQLPVIYASISASHFYPALMEHLSSYLQVFVWSPTNDLLLWILTENILLIVPFLKRINVCFEVRVWGWGVVVGQVDAHTFSPSENCLSMSWLLWFSQLILMTPLFTF